MSFSRRGFLHFAASGLAASTLQGLPLMARSTSSGSKFRVGVTDWNLRQTAKLESIALAKRLGFDGVQISVGRQMQLSDPALQDAFIVESRRVGIPIASLCLDILHVNGLKSDPLGQRWVGEAIPIAKKLDVKVILLPFFGKWALKTQEEMDYVGDALRELAPGAEKAGVTLGLEDTISARDNVRIMDRSRSRAVLTYYDVGNSTQQGFNIIDEIRWLGRSRICEVHLKDNPNFLGQGKIDFPSVVKALSEIGYDRWAQLETDCPTGSVENDMTTNLAYMRGLLTAQK